MEIGLITMGSHPDCDDLPEGGTRARLILMNYSDVDRIFSSDDGRIVSVRMIPDKRAYEFIGFRTDVKKADEVVRPQKSKERFKHFVSFMVYEVDQAQKNNITNVVKGRFIAIIENNGKDENAIELLGRECGLAIVDGQIRSAYDTAGLFVIHLGTPDNGIEFERKLPQALGIDYEDGLRIIAELLNPEDSITFDSMVSTFDSIELTFDRA